MIVEIEDFELKTKKPANGRGFILLDVNNITQY